MTDNHFKYMIDTIKLEARDAAPWVGKADIDPRILAAMAKGPRHEFVPPDLIYAAPMTALSSRRRRRFPSRSSIRSSPAEGW